MSDFIVRLRLVLVRRTKVRPLSIEDFLQVPELFGRDVEECSLNSPKRMALVFLT